MDGSKSGGAGMSRGDVFFLLILFAVCLAVRILFLNINGGEYTDGILQLTGMPPESRGLYPPLYGAMSRLLAFLPGLDLETAGRAVSAAASSAVLFPLCFMAARLGGNTTARMAGLLYCVSPMPLRWGIRVMTDSLYLFWATLAVWLALEACRLIERDSAEKGKRFAWRGKADLAATGFVVAACLASLTRYQGILFSPVMAVVMVAFLVRRAIPALFACSWLLWIPVAMEMMRGRGVHSGQFLQRMASDTASTLLAYWNNFESFVLISPYYFGYPVALFALLGVWVYRRSALHEKKYRAWFAGVWTWLALATLVLQSAFGSFQYRYMMPLLPGLLCLAGLGLFYAEEMGNRGKSGRFCFRMVLLAGLVYLTLFSAMILLFQRETFADQRRAAQYIRHHVPKDTPVYSNERYGSFRWPISVKLTWWSGRDVKPLFDSREPDGIVALPAGSVLVVGNEYGGNESVDGLLRHLEERYRLEPLTTAPFDAGVIPIMDDIMVNPMFNQNPLAWVLRYTSQDFSTAIYRVEPLADGGSVR